MKIIKYTVVYFSENGYSYTEDFDDLEAVRKEIEKDNFCRIRAIIPVYGY